MNEKTAKHVQLIITIVGAITALASSFVAYRLSPIAKDVENLSIRVHAVEGSYISRNEENIYNKAVETSLIDIKDSLARIETRLEKHLDK